MMSGPEQGGREDGRVGPELLGPGSAMPWTSGTEKAGTTSTGTIGRSVTAHVMVPEVGVRAVRRVAPDHRPARADQAGLGSTWWTGTSV